MLEIEYERKIRTLVKHAWDQEIDWPQVSAWLDNFSGDFLDRSDERVYGLFALSKFMYFGRRLIREMLRSLYRDHFESPLLQRIRRNLRGSRDIKLIRDLYRQELEATRFIGVGNPSESGAHLLYYFRQVNRLPKELFSDIAGAFQPAVDRKTGEAFLMPKDSAVTRYVFFDDLVGSGTQVALYLTQNLADIRKSTSNIDIRHMSLFSTTRGLEKMNEPSLFDGNSICLFELDETYKAFEPESRYFSRPPSWFDMADMRNMVQGYGERLKPGMSLGYKNAQVLLGFTHNTPDNSPPIFWDEGHLASWKPVFLRYDKNYGGI
ncbi:hypothetical protein DF133_29805 [Burkholderia cenocepacia]|nr:hypothetical protein DF133_29805 [Burkholderia cenocepacia]